MTNIIPVNTTYEPFSQEAAYVEANRLFLDRQSFQGVKRFLDLACGTGTVTQTLVQGSPTAHLNGIDYDPVQIQLISDRFRQGGYEVRSGFELTCDVANGKPVVVFGARSADDLPFPENTFDCVTIFHAIHMMPDKEKFLAAVNRVLKPGGIFGFNSTFYAGSIPPGGNRLYFEWLRMATEYINEKNVRLKAAGKPPIKRKRGTTHGAFANRWLTGQEWTDLLAQHGLEVHDRHERVVEVDHRSFALVGAYGGLAEVLMSGYPVEESSEALQACAKPAMDAEGVDMVARNYLEIWATKK